MPKKDAPSSPGAGEPQPVVTPEILAEAAVWLAQLHGPGRSPAMLHECRAWQAHSAAHRLAFERCTDTWQEAAGVGALLPGVLARQALPALSRTGRGRRQALAALALGGVAALGLRLWSRGVYSTGVGEQRSLVLGDGSRITLNTATEVRVRITDALRSVTVVHGEALFEVAKDPGRPFVVSVADAQVVATGTAFLVRSTPAGQAARGAFDVALIEGQVIVQRAEGRAQSKMGAPVLMRPGERLRVGQRGGSPAAVSQGPHVDRPPLDPLLAWQRGQVVFDNALLSDAVAEMNRYSKVQIMLADAKALGALRVSGVFRAGDGEAFARAVARLHGMAVWPTQAGLMLAVRQR